MLKTNVRCTFCRRQIYYDGGSEGWYHVDASFDMLSLPYWHVIELPPEAEAIAASVSRRSDGERKTVPVTSEPNTRRRISVNQKKPYDWSKDE